jgi:tRNA threonylcarbamoyl adenosine modification protein YeaZ
MLILAFDTTNEHGGAGIFRNSECVTSIAAANQAPQDTANSSNYSVLLFQMVDRLLAESSLKLRDIELFAVANGPGSFTGIRVGVAAAQAWAQAFARPVLGASVLEAMVEEALPESDCAVAITDGRRGEFFVRVFRSAPNSITARTHESKREFILKWDALWDIVTELSASGPVTCLVRENDVRAQELRRELTTGLGGDRYGPQGQNEPPHSLLEAKPNVLLPGRLVYWRTVRGTLLPAIARLALQAHHDGRLQRPEELDAVYIRRSDAEMRWHE